MALRSLGLRTDLMLLGWEGVIDEHDGAIRARTPSNPDFYYGNFLLYPEPPAPGEPARWVEHFAAAFGDDPRIRHVCLRWDRPDGARGAIDELAGFVVEETVVLVTATPRPPPRICREIEIRAITSDADWAAVTALQVETMVAEWGPDADGFARHQVERARRAVAAGRGRWMGAFVGADLAADMGVFVGDGGIARFQAVETAPAYRRRGICGTLAHHTAELALAELGARQLVIVGLDDHTSRIYTSVGFEPRERLVAALRRPA
jgi:hypothetical protein